MNKVACLKSLSQPNEVEMSLSLSEDVLLIVQVPRECVLIVKVSGGTRADGVSRQTRGPLGVFL